ncbi:hypothetical protein J2I47_19940 [Fibrella sp. HMF5335]|uniref:Glycosyltransferase RgtA/B/C/D-like domain-containing protein n=1 Tax=Fibrella rubiginis TaxID=2817060 RepID=A0A939GKC1_9BACT|nr:hypothetical protein [Fibrella rubiginis]MBO0938834.1 hypothetical protein [Fibrella rubiginis]
MTRKPTQPTVLSVCLFLLLAVPVAASLFFREPWLWMDEVISYTLLTDPSLGHVNKAVVSGMDANPPLFVNMYWLLGHGISVNLFFLKSISIGLFALTGVLFFRYTTRLIGTPVLNFVLLTAIMSLTFLNYVLATQIRTYALYLLLTVGFVLSAHRLIHAPNSGKWLLAHVGIGFLMLMSHNVGLFYMASSMGFFGLLWLVSGQRRYGLITAAHLVCFGLWYVSWYPQFAIQAEAGKPHSWIPVPTFLSSFNTVGELLPSPSSQLEHSPLFSWLPVARVGFVLALLVYVAIPKLRGGWRGVVADPAFSFFLLSCVVTLGTLAIALVVSLVHTSVFLSRYFWPSHLLLAYGLLYAIYTLAPQVQHWLRSWPRLGTVFQTGSASMAFLTVYGLLLIGFVFYQSRKVRQFPSGIVPYLSQLNPRYPVFFESADYFLPVWHYHLAPARYLLDWPSANATGNLPNATVDYNIINGLRTYYGVHSIMPTQELMGVAGRNGVDSAADGHFYVVDEASRYQFERLIRANYVRVIRRLPVNIAGHQILECTLTKG